MDGIAESPITPVELAHVPLDLIDPPSTNCRAVAGDVEDLARSIRIHGVLSPLRLRPSAGGRFEVVAGERRLRAAQLAGLTEVPAAIDRSLTELERHSAQLAENVDRLDLSPLERVQAIQQLLELGMSDEEAARRTGTEPDQVALLRRMAALPDEARRLIDEGAIDVQDAASLAQVDDPEVLEQALRDIADGHHPRTAIDRAPDRVRRRRIEAEARARLERQRIRIIDPPSGYDFAASSTTRQIGTGSRALHVDLKAHRKEPCHAAYLSRWARSARDAVIHVCTDVRRHASDPAAGVDPHLRLPPEDARQRRTERRAQKKAWRQSHDGRRAAATRVLTDLVLDEGIGRVVEEIVGDCVGTPAVELALEMLGLGDVDHIEAGATLHGMARSGSVEARVRVAVALLMARAEVAFAKEHGDYRERENLRAHFRQLTTHDYEPSAGESAQLEEVFGIESLEAPAPRAWCTSLESAADDGDGGEDGGPSDEE